MTNSSTAAPRRGFFSVTPIEAFLCLTGAVFWAWFVTAGSPSYKVYDWPLFHQFAAAYKLAFQEGRWPFYVALFPEELQGSYWSGAGRFLAGVQTMVSPQILVLYFVSVKTYLAVQIVLMFLFGHIGVCAWARKLRMSAFSLTLVFLIYNLGGYFTSKIGIGHMTNSGALLWSLVLYLCWRILDAHGQGPWLLVGYASFLAASLAIVMMQGSTHIFFHMAAVVAVCGVLRKKTFPVFSATLVLAGCLAAVRILPAAGYSGYMGASRIVNDGVGQYLLEPNFWPLVTLAMRPALWLSGVAEGLMVLKAPTHDGVWEVDVYIGLAGVLILFGGMIWICRPSVFTVNWLNAETKLAALGAVFFLCSLGFLSSYPYNVLVRLLPWMPVPERIPSRLMVIPLTLITIAGAHGFGQWTATLAAPWRKAVQTVALLGLLSALLSHATLWQIGRLEQIFPIPAAPESSVRPMDLYPAAYPIYRNVEMKVTILDQPVEPGYRNALVAGASISLAGWAVVLGLAAYAFRRAKHGGLS